ncbi:MAG: hypothetical protein LBD82_00435 [Deltaproteobacteria bacterium]|jgi:hypothetical protein|nr:hypothetical protein [Deltaproteobacteria bacterium]
MFIGGDEKTKRRRFFSKLFWRLAWAVQALLWLALLLLGADYWLYELPASRAYYAAGLEQGFDSLAGIIAAADPSWETTRAVRGRHISQRLSRLQGEAVFSVWLDLDEMPGWHSGLAGLKFDRQGRLVWVSRYYAADPPDMVLSRQGGEAIPVIRPRPELRREKTGGRDG